MGPANRQLCDRHLWRLGPTQFRMRTGRFQLIVLLSLATAVGAGRHRHCQCLLSLAQVSCRQEQLAPLRLRGGMPTVVELAEDGSEKPVPDDGKGGGFHESFSFRGTELRIQQDTVAGHAHVLWDAARVLAGYLDVAPIAWEGKRVLDLGSGCGLTGICVAKHGASVTLTELPGQTSTLQANCEANLGDCQERWTVKEAVWGVVGDETSWGVVTDLGWEWDYILGADLIYSDESTPLLLQTLLHSCRGSTEFLMSFELRRSQVCVCVHVCARVRACVCVCTHFHVFLHVCVCLCK